jgi:ferredoxin
VEDKAALDGALCHECEACLAACPSEAITLTAQEESVAETDRLPALRPEPEVIRARMSPDLVPFRSRVLPVVGAALTWAGREIVPRVVDVLLDRLDRQATGKQMTARGRSNGAPSQGSRGQGRQHRHRRRGAGN